MYLILFMLLFNSVPPIVNATLDKFLPDEDLLGHPDLFENASQNGLYRPYSFWVAMFESVYQSLVQFFIPYFIYSLPNGHFIPESTIGIMTWGTIVTAGCLLR